MARSPSGGLTKILRIGFLLMGFSFTASQGLLIRELLVAFSGNELSIGLILGSWLVLEAIGSGLLGRIAGRWEGGLTSFAALQVLFALFLPLCLVAVYSSRTIVGSTPGEEVGILHVFVSSFLILLPLGLVDGAMFSFGCRAYGTLTGQKGDAIGWVYVYEAAGAVAGGIIFTFLFIPYLLSVEIVLILSALNLLLAALLLVASRSLFRLLFISVLLMASLGLLLSSQAEAVQRWAESRLWADLDLIYSENSPYGNVAVVQEEDQFTFYADGIPVLSSPVPDVVLSEEIVHLPLLFHPQPRRVLVLGGGVGGVLAELAKYPLERIDYAELDPLLIEAVREFPTLLTAGELSDPRVTIENVDGPLLVRKKMWGVSPRPAEGYDLVMINLPYPSTLQLNRYYTVEFFLKARELMSEKGILVLSCPGTLAYMSDELRDLNTLHYHTLRGAFPYVRPIAGDPAVWLASPSDELTTASLEMLVERWEERDLEVQLITASHIGYRLDQRYLDWYWRALGVGKEDGMAAVPPMPGRYVNQDFRPVGQLYGLAYWNAAFSPAAGRILALTRRLSLWAVSLFIVGWSLLFLAIAKLVGRRTEAAIPVVIATTGFTGIAADLLIIFAFQTLYGHVYQWVGLLIAAFMAGLGLGGLLMTRRLASIQRQRPVLLGLELAIVVYWALLPIVLSSLYSRVSYPLLYTSIQWLLILLNGLAGFLVGSQFPLANKIWLKNRRLVGGTAGVLYAFDLLGAFVGSILVTIVLFPVLGILETCAVAALIKVGSLVLAAALLPRS